jgi:stress-induced morphogen
MWRSPTLKSYTTMSTGGPIYQSIQKKLMNALSPSTLEVIDESSKHAGHAAMRGSQAKETHFRVVIISDAFQDKVGGLDLHSKKSQLLTLSKKNILASVEATSDDL